MRLSVISFFLHGGFIRDRCGSKNVRLPGALCAGAVGAAAAFPVALRIMVVAPEVLADAALVQHCARAHLIELPSVKPDILTLRKPREFA
jgi:hypothetical protein